MRLLEFARSTILFRIDLDVLPPRTLSHKPPFAMNNARIQIDSVCRITERATAAASTRSSSAATARPSGSAPSATSSSIPTPTSSRSSRTTTFMHIKTFARAGTQAQAYPPGSGEQSDRLTRADRRHLRRRPPRPRRARGRAPGRRQGDRRCDPRQRRHRRHPPAPAPIATTSRSSTRPRRSTPTSATSSTRPTPARSCGPTSSATRPTCCPVSSSPSRRPTRPTGRRSSCARRTEIADGVEVYHYADSIRVEGIANEFYRLPDSAPATRRRVDLLANALDHHREGRHEDHRHRVPGHRLRRRRGVGRGHPARGHQLDAGTSTRSTPSTPTRASSATRCRTPTCATARR